jgi:hypothetical protein
MVVSMLIASSFLMPKPCSFSQRIHQEGQAKRKLPACERDTLTIDASRRSYFGFNRPAALQRNIH